MTGTGLDERVAILEGTIGRLQRELGNAHRKLDGILAALSERDRRLDEQQSELLMNRERVTQLEQDVTELRGEVEQSGTFAGALGDEPSFAEAR